MKYITFTLVLFAIFINVYSQIDYDTIKNQNLTPCLIDTLSDSILVINKRNAILYFKQTDIKKYLKPYNKPGVRIDTKHDIVWKLLNANMNKIILKDWWSEYTDNDRKRLYGNEDDRNDDKVFLTQFYYIGADLIHDGKFMIVDKKTKAIVTNKLYIKRIKGLYGTRYVEFQLPDKRPFWNIVTRLGE